MTDNSSQQAQAMRNSPATHEEIAAGLSEAEACQRCGGANPSWSAPSPLWNAVMRGGSINGEPLFSDMVCATCFTVIAEERGVASGWRLTAQQIDVPLETETPSGRTWSNETFLWIDSGTKEQPDALKAHLEAQGG